MKYSNLKTQSPNINFKPTIYLILCLFLCACKNRNYILYYNKVNEIDSIYRMAKQPEKAIKNYTNHYLENTALSIKNVMKNMKLI
ncbi:protein of unknown function [Chryseobacterium sp. JV274]|nr:protein of unknown function [Chryseobacterium sp. JV274]